MTLTLEEQRIRKNTYARNKYLANPEKEKAYRRNRYLVNSEKEKIRERKWRLNNPDKSREINKRYYTKHKEEINLRVRIYRSKNKLKAKGWDLKNKYKISLKDFDLMFQEQKGVCAICGKDTEYFKIKVDHCHKTNKVRGLLCHKCNIILGLVGDSIKYLNKFIQYLEKEII